MSYFAGITYNGLGYSLGITFLGIFMTCIMKKILIVAVKYLFFCGKSIPDCYIVVLRSISRMILQMYVCGISFERLSSFGGHVEVGPVLITVI